MKRCHFLFQRSPELWPPTMTCIETWIIQAFMHLICIAGCWTHFFPFSHWGEKICLFYSWLSFWVWKGKIDSAPVGYQWRSDPEKERGKKRGSGCRREVPRLCKPLQFSLECLSLGLNPHGPPPNRFRLKFLHSARPCAPPPPPALGTHQGAFKTH